MTLGRLDSTLGSVLLRKISPGGGTVYSRESNISRLIAVLSTSTPEEVYDLILRAMDDADAEVAMRARSRERVLVTRLEKINDILDSHRLHVFIEEHKTRPHEAEADAKRFAGIADKQVELLGVMLPDDITEAIRYSILAALEETTK